MAAISTPMTQAQWRTQLKKFSVPFIELPTFADPRSGRDDETGLRFGPVWGVGIHHTGDDAPDYLDRKVIVEGRSDLPGPLAHAGLRDDGMVELVTVGRANHFGGGDPDVLAAVKAGSYNRYPPQTDKHQGESGAVDGNDGFYGMEVYYSGGHKMTQKQYDSAIGWAAAICDFHGWSPKHVIGHKEWSDYKIDPGNIDMAAFRDDVESRLKVVRVPIPAIPPRPTNKKIVVAIMTSIKFSKAVEALPEGVLPSKDEVLKTTKAWRKALRRAMERA